MVSHIFPTIRQVSLAILIIFMLGKKKKIKKIIRKYSFTFSLKPINFQA